MKTLQEDAIEQTKLKLTAIIRELQEAKALLEASESAGETPVTRIGKGDMQMKIGLATNQSTPKKSGKVEDSSHIRTSTTDNSPAPEKPLTANKKPHSFSKKKYCPPCSARANWWMTCQTGIDKPEKPLKMRDAFCAMDKPKTKTEARK